MILPFLMPAVTMASQNYSRENQKMRKQFISLFFQLFVGIVLACDCASFPPLKKELFTANPKQLVFRGKVMQVLDCNDIGTCIFEVNEIFSGKSKRHLTAVYDCSSEACQMNFTPGEEWLVYGEYMQVEKIKIEFCSRSRKISATPNDESEKIAFGYTVAEELDWLRSSLGNSEIQPDDENRILAHRNEKPAPTEKIILLVISMAAVIGIILLTKKFLR